MRAIQKRLEEDQKKIKERLGDIITIHNKKGMLEERVVQKQDNQHNHHIRLKNYSFPKKGYYMQTNLLVKRFPAVLAMVMMTVMFLSVGTPAVHAQQLKARQNMVPLAGSQTFLVAPQVSITCGGAIGSATDGNGVPINWTFNTQTPGRTCVTVKYNVPGGTTLCDFLFYVPNRDATGDIFFHFSNGNTVKLNENPVSGFVDLGDQNDVSQVTFTDVNDQTTNSVQLGWGKTASFGLKAVCLA